jgi:hypothetical protein
MWRSIKRWRGWVVNDLWPRYRLGPQSQALHFSFELAGLTFSDEPIPWNAKTVLVEAALRLPPAARRKSDFALRLGSNEPLPTDGFRRGESDERHQLLFRFPPPPATTLATLLWRGHVLGQLTLPVLDATTFLQQLSLELPTVAVRLGRQHIACRTFVASQCRGVVASAVLSNPTSLAPIADLGVTVAFRGPGGEAWDVPAILSSSQLAARQAMLVALLPKRPPRSGEWTATWCVGNRRLATQAVRGISLDDFRNSLRIAESRFVIETEKGQYTHRRLPPKPGEAMRVGPAFFVASREPGMAGVVRIQVHGQGSGAGPLWDEQRVLVTDGPTLVAPGLLDAEALRPITAFELRSRDIVIGSLSLCPTPTASFTPEGGFETPPEFAWTPAAEDELTERLSKLLDGPRE